jgi:hypothetical protein
MNMEHGFTVIICWRSIKQFSKIINVDHLFSSNDFSSDDCKYKYIHVLYQQVFESV